MLGVSGVVTWKVNPTYMLMYHISFSPRSLWWSFTNGLFFYTLIVVRKITFLYAADCTSDLPLSSSSWKVRPANLPPLGYLRKANSMRSVQLILEDNDTIVNPSTRRSYFLKEMGGLENNEDILRSHLPAHLGLLHPEFGRKFISSLYLLLQLLARKNRKKNRASRFWKILYSTAIARIARGCSFAYLKEHFAKYRTQLLGRTPPSTKKFIVYESDKNGEHLDDYELLAQIKKQTRLLREGRNTSPSTWFTADVHDHDSMPTYPELPAFFSATLGLPSLPYLSSSAITAAPTKDDGLAHNQQGGSSDGADIR